MSYERIPPELKAINQWCVWKGELKDNGKLSKVPYQTANGYGASVNNPNHLASFEQSLKIVQQGYADGLLFCLTKNDEYAAIDLDDVKGNQSLFESHQKIFKAFNSYSEISPSGKGLHIICKGNIDKGRRDDSKHIEIYSSERFMAFTGNIYHDVEIAHRQELLERLWEETGKSVPVYEINNKPQENEDDIILEYLFKAANGEKAYALYSGNWAGIYESQSQADIALINMLAFYSKNVEQIERLFAKSALGQRAKASRKDYLGNMIKMAFDRQLPDVDIESLKGLKMLFEQKQEKLAAEAASFSSQSTGELTIDGPGGARGSLSEDDSAVKHPFPTQRVPGIVGEIADYIMQQAPRPCYEIALVGAIGLMAGICGRAFNVSETGLNYYIAILAETSCGKEQIKKGYDNIFSQITPFLPGADSFDGPARFRSGQSLFTAFQESSCFVSIIGEFGMFCHEINSPRASENTHNLKGTLLDLYTKSGFNSKLGKSVYADKLKNTKKIAAPALTIVGESTPDEFYTTLDESSITNGFINRFSIIEYTGLRPRKNNNKISKVPDKLLTKLKDLMGMCLSYNEMNEPTKVQVLPEAQEILNEIDRKADALINARVSIKKDLWGRADLKVQKLAAIIAVGINPWNPVIDKATMQWAYDVVCYEIENITSKYDSGKIGEESRQSFASDDNQLNELVRLIGRYLRKQEIPAKNRIAEQMYADGVFPYSVVQQRSSQSSCFKKDRLGATNAFKRTMTSLIEAGDIEEIGVILAEKTYGKRAKLFAVKNYDRFINVDS